ncbi:hypothetical protein HDU76_006328 [Blyttiomyces sp. JEL0837]|nr:hypothetical protein HDU76_006328 [Blyttiomyces sp. JEL0837]
MSILREMEASGMEVTSKNYSCLIYVWVWRDDYSLSKVWKLMESSKTNKASESSSNRSRLFSDSTRKINIQLNPHGYLIILEAALRRGQTEDISRLYEEIQKGPGFHPTLVNMMMEKYKLFGNTAAAIRFFQYLRNSGIELQRLAWRDLLTVVARDANLARAVEVFEAMKRANMFPQTAEINSLMSCSVRNGSPPFEWLFMMVDNGIQPDLATLVILIQYLTQPDTKVEEDIIVAINMVLRSLQRQVKDSKQGFGVSATTSDLPLLRQDTKDVTAEVLDILAANVMEQLRSKRPFPRQEQQRRVALSVLLREYIAFGHVEEALRFFCQLRHEFKPDGDMYGLVVKACLQTGRKDRIATFMRMMQEDEVLADRYFYWNLIQSDMASHDFSSALVTLRELLDLDDAHELKYPNPSSKPSAGDVTDRKHMRVDSHIIVGMLSTFRKRMGDSDAVKILELLQQNVHVPMNRYVLSQLLQLLPGSVGGSNSVSDLTTTASIDILYQFQRYVEAGNQIDVPIAVSAISALAVLPDFSFERLTEFLSLLEFHGLEIDCDMLTKTAEALGHRGMLEVITALHQSMVQEKMPISHFFLAAWLRACLARRSISAMERVIELVMRDWPANATYPLVVKKCIQVLLKHKVRKGDVADLEMMMGVLKKAGSTPSKSLDKLMRSKGLEHMLGPELEGVTENDEKVSIMGTITQF